MKFGVTDSFFTVTFKGELSDPVIYKENVQLAKSFTISLNLRT